MQRDKKQIRKLSLGWPLKQYFAGYLCPARHLSHASVLFFEVFYFLSLRQFSWYWFKISCKGYEFIENLKQTHEDDRTLSCLLPVPLPPIFLVPGWSPLIAPGLTPSRGGYTPGTLSCMNQKATDTLSDQGQRAPKRHIVSYSKRGGILPGSPWQGRGTSSSV